MAYQKNFDYTAALKKATDPLEKERLEREKAEKIADIQRAGLDYTKAADIKKFATSSVSAPQSETRTQQYTFNELAAQEAGRIAREAIANGTAEPEPELIEYVDQGGNIQRIRKDQVAYVPKEWKLKGAVNQQDQFSTLAKQLADAQKQKNIAALQQAYDKTFSSLQAEKSGLDPMFGAQTRQAVTQSTMGKKSFSDFLAEKGLGGSGLSGQGEIAQNVALQGELGGIEARKGQAFADVARRMTEAQQARDYGIASAESDVAMLNAQQQLERLKQQEQRDYAEQQALKQQEREDYIASINQYQKDYTAEINKLMAEGVPDTDYRVMALKSERAKKVANLEEAKQNAYIQSLKDEQDKQEQAFELAKWRFDNGLPATQMDAQLLGVPVGQISPQQAIKNAELALAQQKKSSGSSSGSKLTYNQALSQARQILGSGASAQSVVNLATQLQSGSTSGLSTSANVSQPTSNKATDALKYLSRLESARDLVSINAFVQNNQSEIDRIASDLNETTANRNAAQQIQKLYYKYK